MNNVVSWHRRDPETAPDPTSYPWYHLVRELFEKDGSMHSDIRAALVQVANERLG